MAEGFSHRLFRSRADGDAVVHNLAFRQRGAEVRENESEQLSY